MNCMKKNVSFTLSEPVSDLLDDMSKESKPHAYKSAIVEEAIVDYSIKINFNKEGENEKDRKKSR